MTRLLLAPRAWRDLQRPSEFLLHSDPGQAVATGELLVSGLSILEQHPLAGREAGHGLRELLISRGRTGYAALYRYDPFHETALVLTLRHQREAGCPDLP